MQSPSASVVALAAALAILLPSLLVLDQPALGFVVIALGVAAMAGLGRAVGVLATSAVVVAPPSGLEVRPVPAAHVSDPVHHPLRPRAPGTA